jgi:hypothetical protein
LVYKICRTRSHSFYEGAAALLKLAMLPFEESAAICWFTRRAKQLQNFLSEVRWKSGVEEILKTRRKRKQSGFPDEFRKPTRNPKGKTGGRGPHAVDASLFSVCSNSDTAVLGSALETGD